MEAGRRGMSVSMVGTRKVTSKSLVCPQVLQRKLHPVHGHADNDGRALPPGNALSIIFDPCTWRRWVQCVWRFLAITTQFFCFILVALRMKSQPPSAEGSLLHLLLAFFFVWPDLLSSCFAYEFPGTARNGAGGNWKGSPMSCGKFIFQRI